MKVYIVRHGEVNHNLYKIYSNIDEGLNDTGIKEANELKEKIKDINYDVVIASPLLRTLMTTKIINVHNKEVIIDDRLKERDPGSLNGQKIDSIDRDEYWNYYSKIQYGTSENIVHFFKRVFDFLDDLKTKDYETVLIVAHSGVSRAFDGYFNGIGDGKFLRLNFENCEIKEYILNK